MSGVKMGSRKPACMLIATLITLFTTCVGSTDKEDIQRTYRQIMTFARSPTALDLVLWEPLRRGLWTPTVETEWLSLLDRSIFSERTWATQFCLERALELGIAHDKIWLSLSETAQVLPQKQQKKYVLAISSLLNFVELDRQSTALVQ